MVFESERLLDSLSHFGCSTAGNCCGLVSVGSLFVGAVFVVIGCADDMRSINKAALCGLSAPLR